jgi:periplasmic mercuric ion binding protein
MKNLARFAVVAVALFSLVAFAKDTTTTMKVSGWMCAACPAKTETALKGVPGVKTVKVDKEKNTATVTYDDAKAKSADLEKAVASAGFSVQK